MRPILTAFIACFVVLTAKVAHSACDECPFPFAEAYGSWTSDDRDVVLEIKELRESNSQVWISINLRRAGTGAVFARGRAIVRKTDRSFPVELDYRTGRKVRMYVELSRYNNELKMSIGGAPLEKEPCFKGSAKCRSFIRDTSF